MFVALCMCSDERKAAPSERQMSAMETEVREWIESNRPDGSVKNTNTYVKQFVEWCATNGVTARPASQQTIARFIKYCATVERTDRYAKPLAKSSIGQITAAIANDHKRHGLDSAVNSQLVRDAVKTAKKVAPNGPGGKLPLTVDMIAAFDVVRSTNAREHARDLALVTIMFAGCLRGAEAVALDKSHISIVDWQTDSGTEEALIVRIIKSKTDQEERGDSVVIGRAPYAAICPVRRMKTWLQMHPFGRSDALFPNLQNGARISNDTPRSIIKRLLSATGFDESKFGGHSARKGGATAAVAAQVALHLLKRHGRWKSDAVFAYVHDSAAAQISVSKALLAAPAPILPPQSHIRENRLPSPPQANQPVPSLPPAPQPRSMHAHVQERDAQTVNSLRTIAIESAAGRMCAEEAAKAAILVAKQLPSIPTVPMSAMESIKQNDRRA